MLYSLMQFKDSIIKKFGPILGYAIIIVGTVLILSILGFLLKTVFKVAIGLIIAAAVLYGGYKAYEALFSKNKPS